MPRGGEHSRRTCPSLASPEPSPPIAPPAGAAAPRAHDGLGLEHDGLDAAESTSACVGQCAARSSAADEPPKASRGVEAVAAEPMSGDPAIAAAAASACGLLDPEAGVSCPEVCTWGGTADGNEGDEPPGGAIAASSPLTLGLPLDLVRGVPAPRGVFLPLPPCDDDARLRGVIPEDLPPGLLARRAGTAASAGGFEGMGRVGLVDAPLVFATRGTLCGPRSAGGVTVLRGVLRGEGFTSGAFFAATDFFVTGFSGCLRMAADLALLLAGIAVAPVPPSAALIPLPSERGRERERDAGLATHARQFWGRVRLRATQSFNRAQNGPVLVSAIFHKFH